jgi:hypothetical protein
MLLSFRWLNNSIVSGMQEITEIHSPFQGGRMQQA